MLLGCCNGCSRLPAAVVCRGTDGLQGKAMSRWRRRAEQDRSAADEWDRIAAGVRAFLRDGADVRAVDEHAAARDEPRWKLNAMIAPRRFPQPWSAIERQR